MPWKAMREPVSKFFTERWNSGSDDCISKLVRSTSFRDIELPLKNGTLRVTGNNTSVTKFSVETQIPDAAAQDQAVFAFGGLRADLRYLPGLKGLQCYTWKQPC